MRRVFGTLLGLLIASNAANAQWQLNLTPGVTPLSHDIYQLHMTIFWICVVIGLIVFGFMFYSIIYHRQSKGVQAAQFHEHLWVELTWTIIPLFILVVMSIPATMVLMHIRDTNKPDMTIKITGFQWKWRYEYLDSGLNFFSHSTTSPAQIQNPRKNADYLRTVDHPLVVPIHKKIRLLITANDVVHSWWVPDLGTKQDAIPGFIIESWTRINRPGTYYGQCAELCGMHHAYMPIVVIAMAEKDFNQWVTLQKGGTLPTASAQPISESTPTTPAPAGKQVSVNEQLMQKGQQIYSTTCAVCHQLTGEGLPPTYPALKGSSIATGPAKDHIHRVLFGKMGTAMQAFKDQLSDEDLAAVITYERNSWGNKAGAVLPADVAAARKEPVSPQ